MTERNRLVSAWIGARTARVSAQHAYMQSRHAETLARWDAAARVEAAAWAAIHEYDAGAGA